MIERSRTQPALSVIIGSQNARASVRECLIALEKQRKDNEVEVIIIDNSTDGTAEIVSNQFPQLKLIRAPSKALMPELWETGIRQSAGEVVAITTSHFVPQENWVERILRAHDSAYAGIGGAIGNDKNASLTDWAVYFCRYSPFMPPFAAANSVADIAGDNASYKRWAIDECRRSRQHGFWEVMVHEEFTKRGLTLSLDPSIVVYQKKSFTLSGFIKQRFRHGRQFGSARAAQLSGLKRIVYITLSPSIPLLFLLRITRRVAAKKRYAGKFLLSLPVLILFLLSWSLGELSGYLWKESKGK